jgi:hypothetical protein
LGIAEMSESLLKDFSPDTRELAALRAGQVPQVGRRPVVSTRTAGFFLI